MNSEKMDSQTKKRKVDDVSSVRGYIHTTNEVKKAMKSETRFFDGTVQISDHEFARFVSFSPEKIDTFLSAQTMKSPVKLNNVRLTPRDGKKEVTFNHTSTIEICSRLDFSRRTEVKPPPAPYKNINEITQPKMMVSVHAKMCGILENKEVDTRYGKKTVQTVVLADATGIIRLTLWEQKQNKVQENICYQISNLISNNFKNYLQLNTTQDTTFTETDPLENVMEDFSSLHNTKSLTGKIEFCSLSSTLKCMQCLKTINLEENQSFVKCGTCGAKQKLSQEQMSDMLKFQLKTMDNKRIKLVMFDVTIKNMKKENKLMGKTNDEIEDFLLDHETWKITTEEGSDLAESISLVN